MVIVVLLLEGDLVIVSDITVNVTDIDECSSNGNNQCSQICVNQVGSYSCSCKDGYVMSDDHYCKGKAQSLHEYKYHLLHSMYFRY